MATGLFEALRRYSPRENRDPLENFITEGFAWLLNKHHVFGETFLKHLEKKLKEIGREWDFGNYDCEWRTQENFGGNYPDMVCHFNEENKAIVFEHKTWSSLSGDQLDNYKKHANNNFADYRIVLITATPQQHEQDPDLALCWSDIYDLIEKSNNSELLIKDFQQLLKSVGLGPPVPISHSLTRYYYEAIDLKKNINNVITDFKKNIKDLIERVEGREVQDEEWKEMIKKDYRLDIPIQRGKDDFYGRIGLDILARDADEPGPGNHGPGNIFVGVLVDREDHKTEPIDPDKGPDFCLIISFSTSLNDLYQKKENYKKLVAELSTKVEQLNDGWEFYDHLDDRTVNEPNKNNPIHIRKPMLDVFSGTESCEDQEERFYEVASKLIRLVVEEESFWALRESLQKHSSQE